MNSQQLNSFALAWTILCLIVFPSGAGAQQNCLKLEKVLAPYNALEPGKSYELKLYLRSRSEDCAVPLEVYGQPHLHPISVRVDSAPGLQSEWIGRGYNRMNHSRLVAEELTLILKVTAAPQVLSGEHSITAQVDYATMRRDGTILPQQMKLTVPVRVVASGTSIEAKREDKWNPAQLLLAPVRIVRGIGEILAGPNLDGW